MLSKIGAPEKRFDRTGCPGCDGKIPAWNPHPRTPREVPGKHGGDLLFSMV